MIKNRRILANRNGWLVGVEIVSENKAYFIVKETQTQTRKTRVDKASLTKKLFLDVSDAIKWINELNR